MIWETVIPRCEAWARENSYSRREPGYKGPIHPDPRKTRCKPGEVPKMVCQACVQLTLPSQGIQTAAYDTDPLSSFWEPKPFYYYQDSFRVPEEELSRRHWIVFMDYALDGKHWTTNFAFNAGVKFRNEDHFKRVLRRWARESLDRVCETGVFEVDKVFRVDDGKFLEISLETLLT